MDKFPEAFRRFESQIDIKDLTSNEIIHEFMLWQGYRPTFKQLQAIEQVIQHKERIVKIEKRLRRGKLIIQYRNIKSGRFAKFR